MIAPEELITRCGFRVNVGNAGKSLESTIQLCKCRLSQVLDYPVKHLKEEVFKQKDRKVIKNVRSILCLSKLFTQCTLDKQTGLMHPKSNF